ncbi:MAG: InlB B-repeat-containing protein, partial [Candidatus Thorarchaeota archaeon]
DSGPAGALLTIEGVGWEPDEKIQVYDLGPPNTLLKGLETNSTGGFSWDFRAPDRKGNYFNNVSIDVGIMVKYRSSDLNETVSYTEFSRQWLKVGNASGPAGSPWDTSLDVNVGESIEIEGNYFNPSGSVTLYWDYDLDTEEILGTVGPNATGYFETTIVIPISKNGPHTITAIDATHIYSIGADMPLQVHMLDVNLGEAYIPVYINSSKFYTNLLGYLRIRLVEGYYNITVSEEEALQTGRRLHFDQWRDDVTTLYRMFYLNSDKVLYGDYSRQNYVTVDSLYGSPQGEGWYDQGTRVTISVDPSDQVNATTRFVFDGWSGDVVSSNPTYSFTVNSPKEVTASWKPQYFVEVSSKPSGGVVNATSDWWDPQSFITIEADEVVNVGDNKMLLFSHWSGDVSSSTRIINLFIDSPKSVVVNWNARYFVEVNSPYGDSSGQGWYDDGSDVTVFVDSEVSVSSGTRAIFQSWSGDISSSDSTVIFKADSPLILTANWIIQHFVTVSTDPSGIIDFKKDGWYNEGSPLQLDAQELIEEGTGTRLLFSEWLVNLDKTANPLSLVIDEPTTAVASYVTQYYLTVNSELGETTGEGWYDENRKASFSVNPPEGDLIGQVFAGWTGDSSSTQLTSTIAMDSPKEVTATWTTNYTIPVLIAAIIIVIIIIVLMLLRSRMGKKTPRRQL